MDCENQAAMLKKLQEIEFVAIELNIYLNTHPCDAEAINDFNCAAKMLSKLKCEYEAEYGPLLNFGFSYSGEPWQWSMGPWPWEI